MAVDLSADFLKPMGEMINSRFYPHIQYFDLGKNYINDDKFEGRIKVKYLCPNKKC